jgi:hypothetical protein
MQVPRVQHAARNVGTSYETVKVTDIGGIMHVGVMPTSTLAGDG